MAGIDIRRASAGETRDFDNGHAEIQDFGGHVVAGRYTFEPGWRWSTDIGPTAGTRTCTASHFGYCVSGRMKVRMDDGETVDVGAGDFMTIRPGHDAWVVGDETCVILDFTGAENYVRASFSRDAGIHAPPP